MTIPLYLLAGALLLIGAFAVVKAREGTLWSPGSVLLITFFVNIFLDPVLRYTGLRWGDTGAVQDAWLTMSVFNATCYAALLVGYMLPRTPFRPDRQLYRDARPGPLFSQAGFWIAALICLTVLAVSFVAMAYWGRFGLAKWAFEDLKPPGYELLVSSHAILFMFIPALFVATYLERPETPRHLRAPVTWGLLALLALFSLALFSRGLVLIVVLTIGLIYHFRFSRFTRRQVAFGLLFALFVVAFTLLRRTETGITNVDWAAVRALMDTGTLALKDVFIIGVTMFEGQEVLANVIILTRDTGLFYGKTYLNTLVTQLVPFYESGMATPAQWYRTIGEHFGSFGRGFGMAAEAYINFGRFGFVVFFFVGLLARFLSFKIYTTRNPVMLVWSAYVMVVLIEALRTDSYSLFSRMVLHVAPLLVFWFFETKLTRSIGLSTPAPVRRRSPPAGHGENVEA